MQTNDYKKFYINRIFGPLLILLLTLILLGITKYNSFRLNRKLIFSNEMSQTIQKQIDDLNNNVAQMEKTYKIWHNLGAKMLTQGLEIEKCRNIINDLKIKHRINTLDVKVLAPVVRDDMHNQHIKVEYSEITVVGGAYTDLDVFNFINDLLNSIPGYLQVTSLKIVNNYSFNQDVIVGIKKGTYKDLVSINMKLIWQAINNEDIRLESKNG